MKKIVTIIDFSTMTEKVIRHTVDLSRLLKAEIILMYLTPPSSTVLLHDEVYKMTSDEYIRKVAREKLKLEEIEKRLVKIGCSVKTNTINGTHVKGLLQKLEELHPNYLIIGAHTRSWLDEKITGSHWTSLIASSKTPIIIIPNTERQNQ